MIENNEIDRQRSYLIYSVLGKDKSKQNSPNFWKTKKTQKSEFVNLWENGKMQESTQGSVPIFRKKMTINHEYTLPFSF